MADFFIDKVIFGDIHKFKNKFYANLKTSWKLGAIIPHGVPTLITGKTKKDVLKQIRKIEKYTGLKLYGGK
jgi:hypothetical protein